MERFASETPELNVQSRVSTFTLLIYYHQKQDRVDIFQSFFPDYEWESAEQWAKEPVPFAQDNK